jgi:hypothetical protein
MTVNIDERVDVGGPFPLAETWSAGIVVRRGGEPRPDRPATTTR